MAPLITILPRASTHLNPALCGVTKNVIVSGTLCAWPTHCKKTELMTKFGSARASSSDMLNDVSYVMLSSSHVYTKYLVGCIANVSHLVDTRSPQKGIRSKLVVGGWLLHCFIYIRLFTFTYRCSLQTFRHVHRCHSGTRLMESRHVSGSTVHRSARLYGSGRLAAAAAAVAAAAAAVGCQAGAGRRKDQRGEASRSDSCL